MQGSKGSCSTVFESRVLVVFAAMSECWVLFLMCFHKVSFVFRRYHVTPRSLSFHIQLVCRRTCSATVHASSFPSRCLAARSKLEQRPTLPSTSFCLCFRKENVDTSRDGTAASWAAAMGLWGCANDLDLIVGCVQFRIEVVSACFLMVRGNGWGRSARTPPKALPLASPR